MLNITRRFNQETGVMEFFSAGQSENPYVNGALINLSRGATKHYRLDNLQAHNTDAPARWNDGQSIHSNEALADYCDRVAADIAEAIEEATERWEEEKSYSPLKSSTPVTLAQVNGKVQFLAAA